MKTIIKVALLQMNSCLNNQALNLKKAEEYCRKAKTLGADIVLFPEMWNIGYTPWRQDIVHQDYLPEFKIHYAQDIKIWQSQAVTACGDYIQHFRDLAKELDLAMAVTYLEKHQNGPRNSVSLIDRFGVVKFTYGKIHTCDFSTEAVCTPGDDFYVCELDTLKGKVNVGTMICFDREFPESARILMLKGAEIILVPNACEMEENRLCQLKSRAFENMVGVALANYAAPDQNGHSCAFDGIAFNEAGHSRNMQLVMADEKEGIFIAEFDLKTLRDWRKNEVWGNAYRKPKYYALLGQLETYGPFIRKNAKK
ncbi:MAG: carbon-nitrogen hydrolase family protein [Gammaproteobacteria bacterium]|nr:carbon-nitrogen hydrolase family protein [Gammaproteobacteria bacterium]